MIYPIPQKNNLCGKPVNIKSLEVTGDFRAVAERVLAEYSVDVSGGFKAEFRLVNSRKTTYIEDIYRLSDEKYFITVAENGITVEASCEKSAFRAAHTLAKLIINGELKEGTLEDYPLFRKRGYIEGFYGSTWEQSKRISVMKLMASYGMNTFFYAPKDDIYHREKWRDFYPEDELASLKSLFETACENMLDFNWAIGPGLTYKYTSDSDFDCLIAKIKSI